MSIFKHRNCIAFIIEFRYNKKNKTNSSANIIFLFFFLSKQCIIMETPAMQRPNVIVLTSNGAPGLVTCRLELGGVYLDGIFVLFSDN